MKWRIGIKIINYHVMMHPLKFFFDYKVEYIIAPNELLI